MMAGAASMLLHAGSIWTVAFSPDVELLESAGFDGEIRLSVHRVDALADLACDRVWRNLPRENGIVSSGPLPSASACADLPSGAGVY